MKAKTTSALRLIFLAAGVALLVALVARLGPAKIAAELLAVGPGILWLLLAYGAGTAVGGLPWNLLLPRRARPGYGRAIVSRFAASGANALLPLFGFGGEPARLLWQARGHRATGVAGIVVDRLLFVGASAMFLLLGVFAVVDTTRIPDRFVIVGAIASFALLVAAAVGSWMVARHRLASRIHRLIRRLRGRALLEGVNGFGDDIDDAIEEIFAAGGSRLAAGGLAHFLGRILLGLEIYAGFRVLGVALTPTEALIFASVPVLLSFVGSIVPSQIGLQEGAQAAVAALLGVAPATAFAVVLLQRVRQVFTIGLAWALIASARSASRAASARQMR